MKFLLCVLLAQAVDAPRIVRLENGDYFLNQAAFVRLDNELKRLQALELQHRSESWATTVLVSTLVGLVVGAAASGIVFLVAVPKAPASPSP